MEIVTMMDEREKNEYMKKKRRERGRERLEKGERKRKKVDLKRRKSYFYIHNVVYLQ